MLRVAVSVAPSGDACIRLYHGGKPSPRVRITQQRLEQGWQEASCCRGPGEYPLRTSADRLRLRACRDTGRAAEKLLVANRIQSGPVSLLKQWSCLYPLYHDLSLPATLIINQRTLDLFPTFVYRISHLPCVVRCFLTLRSFRQQRDFRAH